MSMTTPAPWTPRPSGRSPATSHTWKPSALDVLTIRAIGATQLPDGTAALVDYHGIDVVALVDETLAYTPERRSTGFGNGNAQRLAAALFLYQRHFAPRRGWELLETDEAAGTLLWRCVREEVPDVLDVITRTRHLELLATETRAQHRDTPGALLDGTRRVVRWIDLSDPHSSQIDFPAEPAVPWAVADDPIHMRELAFPVASNEQEWF